MAKGDIPRPVPRPDTPAQQAIRRNLAERAVEPRPVPATGMDNTTAIPAEKPRSSLAEHHDRSPQSTRRETTPNPVSDIPAKDHYADLRDVSFPTINPQYLHRINTTSDIRDLGPSPSGFGNLYAGKTENIERFIERSVLPAHSTVFGHGSEREYQLPDGNIAREHSLHYNFIVPGSGVGHGIERYTRITDPVTVQNEKDFAKAYINAFLNRTGD